MRVGIRRSSCTLSRDIKCIRISRDRSLTRSMCTVSINHVRIITRVIMRCTTRINNNIIQDTRTFTEHIIRCTGTYHQSYSCA